MFWSARLIQLHDCEELDVAEPNYLLPGVVQLSWRKKKEKKRRRNFNRPAKIPAEFYYPKTGSNASKDGHDDGWGRAEMWLGLCGLTNHSVNLVLYLYVTMYVCHLVR